MTTFVVALFLPYTVDFKDPSSKPSPRLSPLPNNTALQTPLGGTENSLTLGLQALLTPTEEKLAGNYFDVQRVVEKVSAALHFAKPEDPRTLRRTDSSVPEWGRGRIFNQPHAHTSPIPSANIASYSRSQEEWAAEQLLRLRLGSEQLPKKPRPASQERNYSNTDWTIRPAIHGNGALANAVRAATQAGTFRNTCWVGTIGFPTDALGEERTCEIASRLEDEYDALTVFVNDKEFAGHYSGYCKTMLWPVFHYQIPDHPKSKAFMDHSWKFYVKVNEAFAKRILKSYKEGDVIWIHDYHLCLVPGMLRRHLPDAKIGFFMHSAFPSSEVFRCLANRKTLLEGVLGSNFVVFQVPEYALHFLQSCSRILLVEVAENGVHLETGFVEVTSAPIGIVPEQLLRAREEPAVAATVQELKERYQGKILLVGKDQLDVTRGVRQKLLAYEMFLGENPDWKEKVVLVQVAAAQGAANRDLEMSIAEIITRINSEHSNLSHQPVVFLKQDIGFSQYLALLTAADILLVTPLRDGMNLTCHEYVICQDGKTSSCQNKYGPLVLSEFTGSAALFNGAEIVVNPWHVRQCSLAIKQALEMRVEEREARYRMLSEQVLRYTGHSWAERLASGLDQAYESQKACRPTSIPELPTAVVVGEYKSASCRLFILDYEGTLAAWCTYPRSMVAFDQRIIDTLVDLIAASDRNIVYVTSAKTPNELDRIFRGVDGLGLVAENGCFVRPFGKERWRDLADSRECIEMKQEVLPGLEYYSQRMEGRIIERMCSLLLYYGNVPEGPEMEAAKRMAGECVNQINENCSKLRLRALPIEKGILVAPKDVNKMTASVWILRHERKRLGSLQSVTAENVAALTGEQNDMNTFVEDAESSTTANDEAEEGEGVHFGDAHRGHLSPEAASPESAASGSPTPCSWPDFLMVAGDDREDEPVFRWAKKLAHRPFGGGNRRAGSESDVESRGSESDAQQTPVKKIRSVFSVCVGHKHTKADFAVGQGVAGIIATLQKIARA